MWALMLGLLRGNGRYPTFYFEPLLPRLPIPDLNSTLDKYVDLSLYQLSIHSYKSIWPSVNLFFHMFVL